MKILWFSQTPCGSIRRYNQSVVGGSWMISLEDKIKKSEEVQLEVAFISNKQEAPFVYDGVKYYPMYRSIYDTNKGVNRIRERLVSQHKKDAKVLPLMLDVVNQSKPDIIHIHGTEEAFGLIAEHIKDIPIVFSIQGLLAPYSEKYFSGMPDKEIYKYESIKDKLKFVSYRNEYKNFCIRAQREMKYLKEAQYILGRTFWDEYITGLLNPQRKYFVVDEILRTPFYSTNWTKERYSFGKFKIMSTISRGIYKGFETVLKVARLLKQHAEFDFEWTIAGFNSRDKWVQIAEKLTLIKSSDVNIVFKGRINAESLSDLLKHTDVYVHVSHIENSPNSVCEAMIVGVPIIASYVGGTGSLMENDKEGLLIQDGDSYAFAGAIVKLQKQFSRAQALGKNAHERAMARHNPNRISSQLFEVYNKVLNEFKRKI